MAQHPRPHPVISDTVDVNDEWTFRLRVPSSPHGLYDPLGAESSESSQSQSSPISLTATAQTEISSISSLSSSKPATNVAATTPTRARATKPVTAMSTTTLIELKQVQHGRKNDNSNHSHKINEKPPFSESASSLDVRENERLLHEQQPSPQHQSPSFSIHNNLHDHHSSPASFATTNHSHSHHHHHDHTGWTLQSPFWDLQAVDLLRVTYFPAWQALPAYTTSHPRPRSSSGSGGIRGARTGSAVNLYSSAAVAGYYCCGAGRNRVEYSSYVYSARDVVHVEPLGNNVGHNKNDKLVHVPGVGPCRSVRLHLRPFDEILLGEDEYDYNQKLYRSIPDALQDAWNTQLSQIHENRQARGLESPPSSTSTSASSSSSSSAHHRSRSVHPTITFCLPTACSDPPLLWKVDFPPIPNLPIAIESLTVFSGNLHVDQNHQPLPSHVYIQGWQSWSFCGSVPRGHPQPTSAMPDVFSKAFLFGGSVPPPADCVMRKQADSTHPYSPPHPAPPLEVQYTSDFFTCITSDGPVPEEDSSSIASITARRLFRHARSASDEMPYITLDETGGPALVLGWLSQQKQFGVVTSNKELNQFQMHCSCNGQLLVHGVTDSITTDWAYAQLITSHSYDEEPLAQYLNAVAGHNDARPLQNGSLLTGWCSWYFAYEKISSTLLRDNCAQLADLKSILPTNVAVVDDGYMKAWGDWDDVKSQQFPNGMAPVSDDIASHRMRPGVWLAPAAADKHSKIAAQHPSWIIRNHAGVAANSSNCGKFFYGLDATHPAVREHMRVSVARAVNDWKFDVLKIDFLYACCLDGNGKFDLSMSRAEAMYLTMQTIRAAAGVSTFLIGCGCPIASAIGFVDAMRVSADTGPTWYPPPPFPWWDSGTLPCLRSMIRNSITRSPLGHRWWHNDPDCLMFGQHTRLTNDEIASAASVVAMTCGMLLLSDDLPKVPESRMRIMSKIFPMTGSPAVVLDLHSTNHGIPSLMRLWCTDRYNRLDAFRQRTSSSLDNMEENNNECEATFFGRQACFQYDTSRIPEVRERSCIHVTKGLGTWTVVSISNWDDTPRVIHIPPPALLPPPEAIVDSNHNNNHPSIENYGAHGYHVFGFWSSRYMWLEPHSSSSRSTVSKKLAPHATEIFHIKPVTPTLPQYIGSDLHFSCGREVQSFIVASSSRQYCLELRLMTQYERCGNVFIFIPRAHVDTVRVILRGCETRRNWTAIGNTPKVSDNGSPRLLGRVIAIPITIRADGSANDGHIRIEF